MQCTPEAYQVATITYLSSMPEAKLQSTIVEPLLRLQGFSHVRDTSGPNDKGKDLAAIRTEFGKIKLSEEECSGIVRKGIQMTHSLAELKNLPIVKRNWPTFSTGVISQGACKASRLSASAVLKVGVPTFITGAPGAGKTTLVRRLAQEMARCSLDRLPLILYLVRYQHTPTDNIVEESARELCAQGVRVTAGDMSRAFFAGKYRLFFDRLDEAADNADSVLLQIHGFSQQFSRCPIVITTRETLKSKIWSEALHIRLAPFDDQQLDRFFRKWFTAEPTKCDRLQKWLGTNSQMRQAARTPLVAALLCSLVHADADMPTTEVELYEQRFELLLGKWERAKGIEPLPQDLRRNYWHFMMNLAADMHLSNVRAVTPQRAVESALDYYSRRFHGTPDGLLRDCLHRGLMEAEPLGGVSFGHLTYQEFLVAKWLAHHNRTSLFVSKLSNAWWEKATNMYASIKGDVSALLEECARAKVDNAVMKRVEMLVEFAPVTPKAALTQCQVEILAAHGSVSPSCTRPPHS